MHVLIIPSWYPSSPTDINGIFFRQQAHALQRAGLKVGVIAPVFRSLRGEPASIVTGGYGQRYHLDEGIPTYLHKSMYFFPHTRLDRLRWLTAGMRLFRRYVRENGLPDILHAHSMNHAGILAHKIHQTTGIPYVLTEHSSALALNRTRKWQRKGMRESAKQCAARIAVSRDFCRLLEKEYPGLDWQYIPNILPAKFFQSFHLDGKPKNQDFTFCSVANLKRSKGFDILLPAFADALKKHPNLKLKIGGSGLFEAQLHKMTEELGIDHAVTFLGKLQNEEVLDLMRSSDAFVLASRYETFGVVFIEALSQGLPVVATRCGGPNALITPEKGLLVPTENQEALAEALVSLYENRHRYDPEALRKSCLEEFGEQSVVRQIIEQYRRVLNHTQTE
ncbi:glycosyltransferase [Neisseria sp. Dent CA1/247]|uniref:glycosyltransferase n=1 Tax=Neisseria sp. Dent CA1/247 TaxID=2912675 RepID=UPI001FD298B6|nr:glycosyltransferase [Neisseria sp. Dent CA1/247]UOO77152.1 glycosyltransferase [Neisseria sp. Dent CA1/247]